jgi:hypothetical protein
MRAPLAEILGALHPGEALAAFTCYDLAAPGELTEPLDAVEFVAGSSLDVPSRSGTCTGRTRGRPTWTSSASGGSPS